MSYTRRTLLKGISLGAGYSLLSPVLTQLALGDEGNVSKLPKRFVFAMVNSGIIPDTIEPPSLKAALADKQKYVNVSLDQQTLEPAMKPLEPLKNYLSIIQGLSGKMCAQGHTGNYGALGVWKSTGERNVPLPKRATVDAMLAKMYPAAINHVALALTGNWGSRVTQGVVYPYLSSAGPTMPIPFQSSPEIAFEQLFGSVASQDKYIDKKLLSKKNLLDFMTDDIKKIQRELPPAEKTKLDHYLSAFEGLQGQDVKIRALKENLEKTPQNLPRNIRQNCRNVDRNRISI